MRKILTLLFLYILSIEIISAQYAVTQHYPKTLWAPNDSFTVRFSNSPALIKLCVSKQDTVDYGSDGAIGLYANINTGNDSIRINCVNPPFGYLYYIQITSPKGKTIYQLHYNQVRAAFSKKYVDDHKNKISIQIPEVYELANIIWTLSPASQKMNTLNKKGKYYDRMIKHFSAFTSHPIFDKLNFGADSIFNKYYDFRENSFAFSFDKKNKIIWGNPYYYVTGNNWQFNSLFKELMPLIEDFAKKSGYRNFYKSNLKYYDSLIQRTKQLLPLQKMWSWLENEFKNKYASYKIVFSPLIGQTHSTQNFTSFLNDGYFNESVMFVSGPEILDDNPELAELQKQGLYSGTVFTEIDHNYVNRVSSSHSKKIDSIFSKRKVWVKEEAVSTIYGSPVSIFNEYMTHALFCIYVAENFDESTAAYIINQRDSLMIVRRGYIKFSEFRKELARLRVTNREKKITDLYAEVIEWSKYMRE